MDINLEPEEGCLTWHVAIPRVDFEYHELVLNENKLVRIVIKKISSGIFDFTIITQGIYDKILAQKEGVKVLYKILGFLSAIETTPIYDPVFTGLTLPLPPQERTETAKYKVCAERSINVDTGSYKREIITDFIWNKIREAIKGYPNPNDISFGFFRQALIQNDSIGQFMLLYNVMLQISNDDQKEVDRQIENISPGIGRIPYSYIQNGVRKMGTETLYSKLRNEVAHRRDFVDIKKTLSDIENALSDFREIVQKCLIRPLGIIP